MAVCTVIIHVPNILLFQKSEFLKKDIEDSNNKEKPVCFRFTLVVLRSKELFVYVTNTNGAREELQTVHNKQVQ
jgi:hypothetical protein